MSDEHRPLGPRSVEDRTQVPGKGFQVIFLSWRQGAVATAALVIGNGANSVADVFELSLEHMEVPSKTMHEHDT
jgi:hypothetical protein